MQKDPSELLENGKVKTLIAQLDADFDVVIIDTAPIVLITDAYLLSSLCDTTLYVVMHKITPKSLVKRIDDNMDKSYKKPCHHIQWRKDKRIFQE